MHRRAGLQVRESSALFCLIRKAVLNGSLLFLYPFVRSSGDTLTRENFYKTKARLAEKRMLTRKSPSSGAIGIGDRSEITDDTS